MEEFSGPIEDFLNQEIPAEVWHYTTFNGFRGIIESGSLWATEAHHTNDSTEFVHTRDVTLDFLKGVKRQDEHFAFALDNAYSIIEGVFNSGALSINEIGIYLVSFSAAEDLKSQWADYAEQHTGVSIAFDLRTVRPPKGSGTAVTFAPCVYEQKRKRDLVFSALSHFVNRVSELHAQLTSKEYIAQRIRNEVIIRRVEGIKSISKDEFNMQMRGEIERDIFKATARTSFDLLRLASHCKNHDFFEEKEWRLAFPVAKDNTRKRVVVKYRGQDHSIPYIEIKLISPEKHPISRVMLGPLCDRRNEIEEILLSRGYSVPIINSNIPLRRSIPK